jgi:hypothetical protein
MTNTTRRRGALVLVALMGLAVASSLPRTASTEVATVDEPTHAVSVPTVSQQTTTTVPITTTGAPITAAAVVETAEPSTTVVSTAAVAPPVDTTVLAPITALSAAEDIPADTPVPAVRVEVGCTNDPVHCAPDADPLAEFHGTFACRFATAGRVTPCCPDATKTLALFWTGWDLAVADYIAGREGGCRDAIINSSGCIGWFQLCGWKCDGPCTTGYNNAEKARWLFDQFGWCSTASWYLAGDRVTGRGGAACG